MDINSQRTSDCIDNNIDEVIEKYSSMVYRIAFTKMRSRSDADDVFQEVFLRYMKNKKPYNSEEHRKAWFIRVTINCCNKVFASSWFKKTEPFTDEPVTVDMETDEKELYSALRKLPSTSRIIIYLFYYEQMPVEKIAAALNLSQVNVRVKMTRARKMLRDYLEGGLFDEQENA